MRLRVVLLLLLCVAIPLAGQNENWHRYQNNAGNFSVLMPADPTDTVNPAKDGGSESHTIQAISDGIVYGVVYVNTQSEQKVDEATFQVYRDAFMRGLPNCTQASEGVASPALPGYIGRMYRMNCTASGQQIVFVGNLYWGKHYAYASMVLFGAGSSDPANMKKFLDSFGVLDPAK